MVDGVEILLMVIWFNKRTLMKLFESKATKLIISLYDGPEQVVKFKALIKELNIPEDFVF